MADVEKPVLTSLAFGITDLSSSPSAISVQATESDPDSSPWGTGLMLQLDRPVVTVISGSHGFNAMQTTSAVSVLFDPDGISHSYSILSPATHAGIYGITQATLTDPAGNSTVYTSAQLASLGFQTSFTVIGHDSAPADVNGDGHSDILWRNANGDLSTWQVSGSHTGSQFQEGVYSTSVDPAWKSVETFDINGDGAADILWRNANGAVAVWTGTANGSFAGLLTDTSVGNDWQIAATGDFNGDGKDDILWRGTGGDLSIWRSSGTALGGAYYHAPVEPAWKVEGAGDFDGDGKADILWRNDSGAVTVWNSTGSDFAGGTYDASVGNDWQVDGIGDFNGDGRDDLFWHSSSGAVSLWEGKADGSFDKAVFYDASVGPDWHFAEIGDFNGDGLSDILWQSDSGAVSIWLADGNGFDKSVFYDASMASGGWSIVSHDFL